ncbi:hypothetical protein [Massilia scottii]|uniref:hypothetical protein n=1 Tax=Massilia scottii TaxID=3057166 RepID=UPI002796602B|nr:hypothetical protein [Massilia sp. CCM 9029]MDQ1834540.1 hypothetical protein [Massilia sp. CCM 9029]
MYALKVRINSDDHIIAGTEDLGVLTATVTCVGKLGDKSRQVNEDENPHLFLTVGGLTSRSLELPDEHLRWLEQKQLHIGDFVSVQIIDSRTADAPVCGEEAEKRKHDEREYFEHCKKVYFELREQYEV